MNLALRGVLIMAIYNDSRVVINLDELVTCRAKVVGEELSNYEVSLLAK